MYMHMYICKWIYGYVYVHGRVYACVFSYFSVLDNNKNNTMPVLDNNINNTIPVNRRSPSTDRVDR
jgi:hypothetical protein